VNNIHNRRLKLINLVVDGSSFECQVNSWKLDPGIKDGDRIYSFCPDGEDTEETDPEPTLELKFFADWRSAGISTYLWKHGGETVAFTLDHHPDIVGEHKRWTGELKIQPAPVGGDARETEMTEITLQCIGMPEFEEVA
jgi:hypothetical protein